MGLSVVSNYPPTARRMLTWFEEIFEYEFILPDFVHHSREVCHGSAWGRWCDVGHVHRVNSWLWSGVKVVSALCFLFFFGCVHGNFFGILVSRNDIAGTEIGGRSINLGFRSDTASKLPDEGVPPEKRPSVKRATHLPSYQQLKKVTASQAYQDHLCSTNETTTTSPSMISSVRTAWIASSSESKDLLPNDDALNTWYLGNCTVRSKVPTKISGPSTFCILQVAC